MRETSISIEGNVGYWLDHRLLIKKGPTLI